MKHPYRRPFAVVAALVLCAGLAASSAQAPTPDDVIKTVQGKLAPDTRLAVFVIKAEQKDGALEVSGEVDRAESRDAVLEALRDAGHAKVVDKIAVLPDPGLGPRIYGFVNVSVAVQKTKPSHASELGNQLVLGMPVKVLKRENGWLLAQSLDDKYLGWMGPGQLALMTAQEAEAFRAARRVVVTSVFDIVRQEPSGQAEAVSDVVFGNVLQLKGEAKGWYSVQMPDGRPGYLPVQAGTEYAAWKTSRRVTPENIESTARLFIGVPYLWGGTSAKGFDCSGFTKTVFRANGVELQRDADQQARQGDPVSTDNDLALLRKGDLLYFSSNPGDSRVTHTGIYLGAKLFIHAASGPGRVNINSFDPSSPIYSDALLKRIVTVRRMAVTP